MRRYDLIEGLNGGTSITNFYFNTDSKQFTVTVNFFHKETKMVPKRPILCGLVYQRVFGAFFDNFPIFEKIPEDCRRLPKTNEDVLRLPKM